MDKSLVSRKLGVTGASNEPTLMVAAGGTYVLAQAMEAFRK